jgi:molybdopterin-containing oxidoreductase family membrane subunit
MAWYSGVEYEQYAFLTEQQDLIGGHISMMTCNVFSPQFMWFKN